MANDWMQHADYTINNILNGNVSWYDSTKKDLLTFGRNTNVSTTQFSTVMTLNGSEVQETYIQTNGIDTISSSSASDTEDIVIEGHTIDVNGDFTQVIQTATLNGQNKVTLSTPIARITNLYNDNSTDLIGFIYVYEDTTIVDGEPTDDTKIHAMIREGYNSSEKVSTTVANNQYWVITNMYADVLEKVSTFASVVLEVREKGKVFRQVLEIGTNTGSRGSHDFRPYYIVPPNSDVRIQAIASSLSSDISAGLQGYLLTNK